MLQTGNMSELWKKQARSKHPTSKSTWTNTSIVVCRSGGTGLSYDYLWPPAYQQLPLWEAWQSYKRDINKGKRKLKICGRAASMQKGLLTPARLDFPNTSTSGDSSVITLPFWRWVWKFTISVLIILLPSGYLIVWVYWSPGVTTLKMVTVWITWWIHPSCLISCRVVEAGLVRRETPIYVWSGNLHMGFIAWEAKILMRERRTAIRVGYQILRFRWGWFSRSTGNPI